MGDSIYRIISSTGKFSPENLLDNLHISSEHEALELADRVESSMYTWRRKACIANSQSSWDMVKQLISETERSDKNYVLAERAENLLLSLKQRYPELSQTSLDTCKIQYNKVSNQKKKIIFYTTKQQYSRKIMRENDRMENYFLQDVGQAILESYSRVLESLAFSIVSWIDDVLHEDRNMRSQERSVEIMQNRMSKLDMSLI